MITVKLESSIKDGDNINFKDVNPGDFLEFSIPSNGLDREYKNKDEIRVGPLTGIVWTINEDSFIMKVTGNPMSNKKPATGKIYKVEYHYDFYDDYGNGDPKSTTFISSVLIQADSEDEAIDKVIEHDEEIWDKHYPYIDGDPYDFEVVGEWDSIEDYNAQYPYSNINLLESVKVCEADSFYDKYKYYFTLGEIDCPNPTFTDDFRRYCTRAGIPYVYYSAHIKNGKPYYSNYGYLYLLKDKSDMQKVYDIVKEHHPFLSFVNDNTIYGPYEFNKDEWKLQDMDSDTDAYVIYSHPLRGSYYHSKNPSRYEKAVYLMKAKNDHEAEREFYDYFDKHKGNELSYFYKKMKRSVAERIFKNKKTEAVGDSDKVYVMFEYTSYPEYGIDADDFNPLFIMNATNDAEAEKEVADYNYEHSDEVTRDHSYFYQEMTREEAYELLGDPNEEYPFYEKYIPIREALEDDPEDADQEFSSAKTSIKYSGGRLPVLFKMVKFDRGTVNLDYGGGAYDDVSEYLKSEYDVTNLIYDKYNRSTEHNKDVLNQVRKNGGADTVTCSNVLNVIKEPEARLAVIKNCKNYLKSGGTAYFTTWEGSGKGNEGTTKSGYQLNRKTADYLDEIKSVFSNVIRKGKLIIAK